MTREELELMCKLKRVCNEVSQWSTACRCFWTAG